MNGRKPNKEEKKWLDAITELGCIVCRQEMNIYSPAEVHHINGGSNHLESIPLCFEHHRSGRYSKPCTSRHPYKGMFFKLYGSDRELLDIVKEMLK